MEIETHSLGELNAYRFQGEDAKYALIISHGLGGHGGIYNIFCQHHAPKGADIWSFDAPGHGRSNLTRPRGSWTMAEWAQASRDFAAHVKELTSLPVFTLGSSMGVSAAISAIDSPAVTGAICMGSLAVPGSQVVKMGALYMRSEDIQKMIERFGRGLRLDIDLFFDFDKDYGIPNAREAKLQDPLNTWSYDLASWVSLFTYEPPQALSDNTKPVLYAYGEKDELVPAPALQMVAAEIGGEVTIKMFKDAPHQLMLFRTEEFSDAVQKFCLANI